MLNPLDELKKNNGIASAQLDFHIFNTNPRLFWNARKFRIETELNYNFVCSYNKEAEKLGLPKWHIIDPNKANM
jgi:c-di-GMP-binding flagellar brake protein YcgR